MPGKYFHSICHHLPDQFRVVLGRLANAEKEERQFKFISSTASQTSNHHPEHKQEKVIDPIYVENTQMCNIYKQITLDLKNSCIPFELIEDHWKEYQLFLEKIADYLVDASSSCENEFGVESFLMFPQLMAQKND